MCSSARVFVLRERGPFLGFLDVAFLGHLEHLLRLGTQRKTIWESVLFLESRVRTF